VDSCSVICPRGRAAWQRQGRRVWIGRPPQGLDFNDLLLGAAPEHVEGAA
jgi:hypothetical protein